MDKKTTRRNRLQLYIDQECGGNTSEFARRVKRSSQQIVDMLKGRKSFGEKVAAYFCEALGLPVGWFDGDQQESVALSAEEKSLVDQFRRLPTEDRVKVRAFARALAVASEAQDGFQNKSSTMSDVVYKQG